MQGLAELYPGWSELLEPEDEAGHVAAPCDVA
jgi:hypothetical protein